jgi:hypothetical protein
MTTAAWAMPAIPGQRTDVRLRAVPQTEPPPEDTPNDDLQRAAVPASVAAVRQARARLRPVVQGTLALVAEPRAARAGRADPATGAAMDALLRPDGRRWAMLLAQGIVEVASGERPMSQLSRWTTFEVYESLRWTLTQHVTRRRATLPGTPRATRALSVHVSAITPTVVEACATIRIGPRVHALAYRLEATDTGWQCTAADLQ